MFCQLFLILAVSCRVKLDFPRFEVRIIGLVSKMAA